MTFALSLCREIHRIYDAYLLAELAATDDLRTGLHIVGRTLSYLQGSVVLGMPAMRIRVADSQTREMQSTLFARVGMVEPSPPAAADPGTELSVSGNPPALEGRFTGGQNRGPSAAASCDPASAVFDWLRIRWGTLWDRSRPYKTVVALLISAVVVVAIDLPITVIVVFPSLFIPLSASFTAVGLGINQLYRIHSGQLSERRERG